MDQQQRKILVTSALPYANGSIHVGHMVEHIQSDIWIRALRLRGHECHFVCADDAHGTPIMVNARKRGITPEQLITESRAEHEADLDDFGVHYDFYHTTHSPENQELVEDIFAGMQQRGLVEVREIEQYYDEEAGMFLPDRFIKGQCPRCKTPDQYGDACENCMATYSPTDLIEPYSTVSGSKPVLRTSDHYFVKLSARQEFLEEWVARGHLQDEVVNKLNEWFEGGLQDWDISRDSPYFGFNIPGEENKFFYVWVDAPIGYMASFRCLCREKGIDFDQFWRPGNDTELYHFIGKDIVYFHTLFWPTMLEAAGYRLPTSVFVHGFLTVDGKKMSKSRGTFIMARTYLDHLAPDYLRYYFASKLGSGLSDIDLNLEDFVARVNSDLVGKVVNIASRCAGFIKKHFDGRLAPTLPADDPLTAEFAGAADSIAQQLEAREYNRAVRQIMALADQANRYIDEHKPWQMIKQPELRDQVHQVCSLGINLFRCLMVYLKPIIPFTAARAEEFLNAGELRWSDVQAPLLDHAINPYQPLMVRIDDKQVSAIIEASRDTLAEAGGEADSQADAVAANPIADEITIDDFARVDLRVGRIIEADFVEGADKLLRLRVDIGIDQRQVFAGIKAAYDPSTLINRKVVLVANLAPRKMRFGESQGMVLAAGPGGKDIFLLDLDDGAEPGMRVT
ncbi:MAG: methionine--tRNA ligase [Xanthomonadales bacterium]|nr:methionine--tRNA ligase [Xanthomonadales bacterium]